MNYFVDNQAISYEHVGETHWGKDIVLVEQADDLTMSTPWAATGFTVEDLFEPALFDQFLAATKKQLRALWRAAGLTIDDSFELTQYHHAASTQEVHLKAVDKTKLLSTENFPVDIRLLEQRISQICAVPLKVFNPFDRQSAFHYRVVRPRAQDNNPLHRDVWLEDYDNCINLYIPIAGSDKNSSLILGPGTHRWRESDIAISNGGALINGQRFNVPAVTDCKRPLHLVRPNPGMNQVLIFSPYLIHGGAANLNADATRISIEVRLWRV
ncbi:MAG: hypothetical protein HC859_09185 [Bacteroidia bacterium]|nr:hypothetical protein [Bacteroidia bacterium]